MKTFQRDLSSYDTVFWHARSTSTCVYIVRLWRTPSGTNWDYIVPYRKY